MALYHMPPVGCPLYRRLLDRKRSLPGCRSLYGGGPDGSRLSFDHRNGMQQVSSFIRNRHLYSQPDQLTDWHASVRLYRSAGGCGRLSGRYDGYPCSAGFVHRDPGYIPEIIDTSRPILPSPQKWKKRLLYYREHFIGSDRSGIKFHLFICRSGRDANTS